MPAKAKTSAVAVAVVLTMTAGAALAATAAETIAARQQGYKQMGGAFKAINDELKKDAPSATLIAAQAKIVNTQSRLIPAWFPKGSGPEAGVKTKAKSDIWSNPAKFAAAAKGLQTESAKLQTIAAKGDVGAIRTQFRATGATCKTCHDSFRAE